MVAYLSVCEVLFPLGAEFFEGFCVDELLEFFLKFFFWVWTFLIFPRINVSQTCKFQSVVENVFHVCDLFTCEFLLKHFFTIACERAIFM